MIDELLFTLAIARQSLPEDAHPIHKARMLLVERIVKRAIESEPAYWRESFEQAEQIADDVVMRRLGGSAQP